ncbi:PREDICTED: chromatin modification-related protein EAF1-like [Elephantulus edwardii]|uniref:chromatin modification-related protein EAF1-like n=1 Tax=Elephantulus edwardii TaxID=28737 RepID=UPI0003F0A002|nr:PREDICTED: chromatin modification-related protein EAF1-like [Elephantulus edwardii]
MPVVPEQQNAYVAQDMSQFQAPQELNPSRCGRPKVIRPSPQPATPSRIELQNILNPGSILPTQPPNQAVMGMVLPNSGQQPPLYTESQRAVPSTSSQHLRNLQAAPPRAPPAGFSAGPLGSQSLSSQQLQRSSLPTSGLRASWEPVLGQADDGSQQQVVSSAAGVLLRAFPTQQAIASPSPMATRVPPSQTATAALASIQSPAQGPGLVLSIPQALQQGLGPFSPVSPAQGIEPPPSYESTMAAAASASTIAASQSPGLPTELASYDPVARPLLNNLSSASEVDVIEALLGSPNASPSKDWMGSQRSVDFLLEQDAAAPQNALNPGDSDDQETGPLPLNRDRPL